MKRLTAYGKQISLRLATFIIDGLKSKIRGFFHIFRDTQNIASAKLVFDVTRTLPPEANPLPRTAI
jgi:hypothetical protein